MTEPDQTANNLREAAFDISRVLTEAGIDPRKIHRTMKSIRDMLEEHHKYGYEYSSAINKGCSMGKWAGQNTDLRLKAPKTADIGVGL